MAGLVPSEESDPTMKNEMKAPHKVILIDDTDTEDVKETIVLPTPAPENNSADWERAKNINNDPVVKNDVRITYVCKHCSFRAQGLSGFMEHLKVSHPSAVPNPIYVCRQCKFRTPNYEGFMQHNASCHTARVQAEKAPDVPKQTTVTQVCPEGQGSSAKPAASSVPVQNKNANAPFLPLNAGPATDNSSEVEDDQRRNIHIGKNRPLQVADIAARVPSPVQVTSAPLASRANLMDRKISIPSSTVEKTKTRKDAFTQNTRPVNKTSSTSATIANNAALLNAQALSSKIIAQNHMNVEPSRTTVGINKVTVQNDLKLKISKKNLPKPPQVEPLLNQRQEDLRYTPVRSLKVDSTPNGKKEPLKNISDNSSDVHTTSSVDEDFDKTSRCGSDCALTISIPSNSIPAYNPAMDLNPFLINSLRKFPYPQRTEICYLALVTGHTQLEVAIWFMAQRLLNGISWTPEEVERIKRKGFVTNCSRATGKPQNDSGSTSENAPTPNSRENGDDRAAAEDEQLNSNQRKTTARARSPQPANDTSASNRKRKAEDDCGPNVTDCKKSNCKTPEQLSLLQEFFAKNKYPDEQELKQISMKTSISTLQVRKWFQQQRIDCQTSANHPVDAADMKGALPSQDKNGTEAALPTVMRNGDATKSKSGNVRTASTYLRNYYINMLPDFTPHTFKEKTKEQLTVLEASFEQQPWPLEEELERLHVETKLTHSEVEAWFCDQRQQRGISMGTITAKHPELAKLCNLKTDIAENVSSDSTTEKLDPVVPLEPDKGSIEVVLENDDISDDFDDNDNGIDIYSQGDSEDSTMSVTTVKLPQGQLNNTPMLGNLEAKSTATSCGPRRFKTKYQLEVLSASFYIDPKPSKEEIKRLVEVTNLTPEDIVAFFKCKLKAKRRQQKFGSSKRSKAPLTAETDTGHKKTIDSQGQLSKSKSSHSQSTKKTQEQLNILKSVFVQTQWPTNEEYTQMVEITNLSRTVIVSWFGDMRYGAKHNQLRWMRDFQKTKKCKILSDAATTPSNEETISHKSPMKTQSSSPKSSLAGDKLSADEERSEKDESHYMEDELEPDTLMSNEDVLKFKGKKAARRGERRDGYAASDVTDNSDNWGEGNLSEDHSDDECSNIDDSDVKSK